MKTKIYLVISAIIQIILALYSIVAADQIVNAQMLEIQELIQGYEEILGQDITELVMSKTEIIVMSSINIILNIIALIIVLRNKMVKNKGKLIVLWLICLLTTPNTFSTWIILIDIVVLMCIKGNKQKFNITDAENILKVEYTKPTPKQILLMVVLVYTYFLQAAYVPESIALIYVIIVYVALFIFGIFAFFEELRQGARIIKNNFKVYIKYILRVFAVMFVFVILANIITMFITHKSTSVNQETIEALPSLIIVPIAVIWAPIVEEAIFRGCLRKCIKNNNIYIILSALVFGLLHALGEATLVVAIATSIPYAVIGGTFAYIYAKTNNIACSMLAHSMYNLMGSIFILIG